VWAAPGVLKELLWGRVLVPVLRGWYKYRATTVVAPAMNFCLILEKRTFAQFEKNTGYFKIAS